MPLIKGHDCRSIKSLELHFLCSKVMPVLVALQLQLAGAPTFFNDSRKLLLLLSDNTARISFVSNITPFLVDFCNALLLLFCIYQIQFNPSEWMEKEGEKAWLIGDR